MDAALKESRKPGDRARLRVILAVAVVAIAIVGIGAALLQGRTAASRSAVDGADAAPPGVSIAEGVNPYPSVTPRAGSPQVVLFTDLQCPGCAGLERENGEVIQEMAASGRIALRNFPMVFLDRKFRQGDHGSSNTATNAALCAAEAEKYNEFSREMFTRQPQNEPDGFPGTAYADAARAAGVSQAAFDTCFDSRKYDAFVVALDDEAAELNTTNGTPAMTVNGQIVSDEDMRELISTPNSFESVLAKYS